MDSCLVTPLHAHSPILAGSLQAAQHGRVPLVADDGTLDATLAAVRGQLGLLESVHRNLCLFFSVDMALKQ